MIDLDELERLEREATPGPWEPVTQYFDDDGGWASVGPYHCVDEGTPCEASIRDADLVAALRNAAPEMIATMRHHDSNEHRWQTEYSELEAEVERLRAEITELKRLRPGGEAMIDFPKRYRPSNGAEGEMFAWNVCRPICSKIAPSYDGCGISDAAMIFGVDDREYPTEWIYGPDGLPTCTAFERRKS